jgi:hypothetical protein
MINNTDIWVYIPFHMVSIPDQFYSVRKINGNGYGLTSSVPDLVPIGRPGRDSNTHRQIPG